MSGASFFGSPSPTIGHNEYLGWSHTVNDPDIVDLFIEKFERRQESARVSLRRRTPNGDRVDRHDIGEDFEGR